MILTNALSTAIQGIGGGGIINLAEIITSDLVPLAERGLYQGILGLTWSFASGIGPPIVTYFLSIPFLSYVPSYFREELLPKRHRGAGFSVRTHNMFSILGLD